MVLLYARVLATLARLCRFAPVWLYPPLKPVTEETP